MSNILIWSLFADVGQRDDVGSVGSGIAGLLCCGSFVALPLLWFGIGAALCFWVAKDAKSRGMEGAIWIILMWFTGPIGLAIYVFSRPQGRLVQCPNCGNNRMEASIKCPHCGAGEDEVKGARRKKRRNNDDDEDEADDRTRR
jgi:hypothetical protein